MSANKSEPEYDER